MNGPLSRAQTSINSPELPTVLNKKRQVYIIRRKSWGFARRHKWENVAGCHQAVKS
jgi:hypothetical protein